MKNAWFRLGPSLIGKQNEGLSIGGFLSSMLAIMLANYAEHSTITSALYGTKFFKNDTQILDGLRATDDGLIFVAIDKNSTHCFKVAFNLLLLFKKKFIAKMGGKVTLEFDSVALKYIYLENIIFNAYSDIFVSFHNKNFESITINGEQNVIKGAHKHSMSSNQIKINSLAHTFCRIEEGCSLNIFTSLCSWKFILEVLICYKWPINWIIKSLHSNNKKRHNDIWFGIIKKLNLLGRQYSNTQCMLHAIKKDIIDCDEYAVVCIIEDVMNTFLGRESLLSGGRSSKG
jgi:hypothetical protein